MRVRNERQDEFIEKIKAIREEAGQKVREQLSKEYEEAQKEGKHPWGGLWLKPAQIEGLIRQIKAKEKVVFGEILLILFVLLLCSWFFFRLLVLFFLPR